MAQQQRLQHALTVLRHVDAGTIDDLRRVTESDLMYAINGIAPMARQLRGSVSASILLDILNDLESHVREHPLRFIDVEGFHERVDSVRAAVGTRGVSGAAGQRGHGSTSDKSTP
jgi:hypothetical protein